MIIIIIKISFDNNFELMIKESTLTTCYWLAIAHVLYFYIGTLYYSSSLPFIYF